MTGVRVAFGEEELNPVALERAEKGLAWLKEAGPFYGLNINLVNLETLNLASDCECVLGQLALTYSRALDRLEYAGVFAHGGFARQAWAREHGFDDQVTENVFYSDLDEAWDYLLTRDRAEDNQS
jgi:hypothetical protein